MTLPANDAFSLHDQPRRSSSLSRHRSPSPKISFSSSSGVKTSDANGMVLKRNHNRRVSSQQNSNHSLNGEVSSIKEHPDELLDARKTTNKHSGGTPNGITDKGKAVKKSVDWEIPRKALHSSIGFFTIYLYTSHGSPTHVVVALSSALAILIPVDILRLRYPAFERAFEKCVGIFMRDSEKKSSNGVIWYILGANITLLALPLDIAVVAILILSWADTAASTFGRMFGAYTPALPRPFAPRKSLAGFIAAAITGACIAAGFWTWIGPLRDADLTWSWEQGVSPAFLGYSSSSDDVAKTGGWAGLAVISLFAGLVTGVAEALDLGSIDDNLSLPIIAGGCIWGLLKLLGNFSGSFPWS
ncbi:hypothetical protein BJ138DRAFT_1181212 [Hygrophoropsis aurantiaca]|uniref:Uncharacterized protein n=1 Tax=Hygrophoropsis aurantiaca TaxID=72124 RepID=A0ACB8A6S9_9AGAM|nr:hypothetical protein BJ138DRAFT_1181212 [Hygrophoropsis aurantiaca]